MRYTLRFFALLDVISIFLLAQPVWEILSHFKEIPYQFSSQAKAIIIPLLFISLFISAIGLMGLKRFGAIAYYIQFPFRLLVWVFSVGFITYLQELLNLGSHWFNILFKLCFIAEFFRLYFTILADRRKLFRNFNLKISQTE